MKTSFLLLLFILSKLAFGQSGAQAINPDGIKKAYYLLASATGMGKSSMGHGYLRLGVSAKPSVNDYVIEFVADAEGHELSYIRGIGIGENYKRSVAVKKFGEIIPEMTIYSDRDLISYELDLTDENLKRLVQTLNKYVEVGQMGDYSFFKNNCAQAVSALFREAGIPISGMKGVFPKGIPQELAERKLIRETYTELSISNKREELFHKYESAINGALEESLTGLNPKFLYSKSVYERATGYTALAQFLNSRESKNLVDLNKYLKSFVFLEYKVTRQSLIDELTKGDSLNLQQVSSQEVDISRMSFVGDIQVGVEKTELLIKNGKFFLKHRIKKSGQGIQGQLVTEFQTIMSELKNVKVLENNILINGQYAGIIVPKNISKTGLNLTHAWFADGSSYDEKTNKLTLNSFAITQKEFPKLRTSFLKSDENALKNNNSGKAMCAGLIDLQKGLLERVIFSPEGKRLSDKENLSLVSELLAGKMVIVPGFSNIHDFTDSLPREDYLNIAYSYHSKKYGSMSKAIQGYFESEELNKAGVEYIGALAKKGIYTPISFRVRNNIGHAVLVTGVKEKSSGIYAIETYDVNTLKGISLGYGSNTFTFDTNSNKLSSYIYGSDKAFIVKSEKEADLFMQSVLSNPDLKNYFLQVARKYNNYSFSISEIVKAL